MKARKLQRRWWNRKERLLEDVQLLWERCCAQGKPEQVHELRVTLRRLRLFVRLGRPWLDEAAVGAFRSWARGVSKATSPVRDWDVALEWLCQQADSEELVERALRRRDRLWWGCKRQLRRPPPQVLVALVHHREGTKAAVALDGRCAKLVQIQQALAAFGTVGGSDAEGA